MSAACMAIAIVCSTISAAPQKYALLAAVSNYQHAEMNKPRLEYPETDAKAVRDLLSSAGYEVDLLLGEDATQAKIREKLNALRRKGNDTGVVLLGLFGHGVEYEATSEAFFCPYDAAIRDAKDAGGKALFDRDGKPLLEPDPESLIKMSELLSALRLCPAGNRILLADCCRESPNRPRGRAFGANLKLTDLPNNTAAMFACSANEQAFEHRAWGHGAFTKALLDQLPELARAGDDNMNTLGARVRRAVSDLVRNQSNGRDHQTVHPIVNGVVDLQLPRTQQATVELTGIWNGTYRNNPADGPTTFQLILLQRGRRVHGYMREANPRVDLVRPWIHSTVNGSLEGSGRQLKITKDHDDPDQGGRGIVLRGNLSADAQSIGDGIIEDSSIQFMLEKEGGASAGPFTGHWEGAFHYPAEGNRQPGPFQAIIVHQADKFVGYIKEANSFSEEKVPYLYGTIVGRYDSISREFTYTKTYDGTGKIAHDVYHKGRLSPNGAAVVDGTWDIPNAWGAKFELQRSNKY